MIKIGVSSCFMYEDPARLVYGHKCLSYIENDMARFLADLNVMPILIPDLDEKIQNQYLEEVDAFVFQGGADISPETYGEEMIENGRWPGDRYRDKYEFRLMDYAYKTKKPVLGICRGFQLINTYFGGTLYQDLATQTNTSITHRCAEQYDKINHTVDLKKDSLLFDIYKKENIGVNSIHHQGVKDLSSKLVVEAVCPDDNLIEAYRFHDMNDHFIWAFQWHPEFNHTLGDKIAPARPIFEKFIEVVKERKK